MYEKNRKIALGLAAMALGYSFGCATPQYSRGTRQNGHRRQYLERVLTDEEKAHREAQKKWVEETKKEADAQLEELNDLVRMIEEEFSWTPDQNK